MAGAIIVDLSGATVGVGTRYDRYRDVLAEELGFRQRSVVTTTASVGDAARVVFLDDVRDDEADETELGGWWLYVVDGALAGSQRRVLSRGHQGNEAALVLSRPFPAAIVAGTSVILTSPLPIGRSLGIKGIGALVNEALDRILIEGRIPFVADGSNQQSLTAYPFLHDISQTTGLYDRTLTLVSSDANERSPYGYRLAQSGGTVALVTEQRYATGTAYELGVIAKASELTRTDTQWVFGAQGLSADGDEAAAPETWVRSLGMVKALQHLERVVAANPRLTDAQKQVQAGILTRRKAVYAQAAATIVRYSFPKPYVPARSPLVTSPPTLRVPV